MPACHPDRGVRRDLDALRRDAGQGRPEARLVLEVGPLVVVENGPEAIEDGPEGGRRLTAQEFLAGYPMLPGLKLG